MTKAMTRVKRTMPVEIEYDTNFHGGDYDRVGDFVTVFVPEDADESAIYRAFNRHTGLGQDSIVHWRIMQDEETAAAEQVYLAGLLDQMVYPETSDGTIDGRFHAFHNANPHICRRLTAMALELRGNGIQQYGMKALYEVLRYQVTMAAGRDGFRLNNSYTSRYARLIMDNEPLLDGFFETRTLRTA